MTCSRRHYFDNLDKMWGRVISSLRNGSQKGMQLLSQDLPASRISTTATSFTPAAAAPAASAKPVLNKEFAIYRWSPEDGEKPRYDTYTVDLNK